MITAGNGHDSNGFPIFKKKAPTMSEQVQRELDQAFSTIRRHLSQNAPLQLQQVQPVEPVTKLLREGVSNEQIAVIYGRRCGDVYEGPFWQENNIPDTRAIEQQAKYEKEMATNGESSIEPIIPPGWVPPWLKVQFDTRNLVREYIEMQFTEIAALLESA